MQNIIKETPEMNTKQNKEVDVSTLVDKVCDLLGGEERFDGAPVTECPYCGAKRFVKNGHGRSGDNRYLCRDCGRTFSVFTNAFTHNSRRNGSVWKRYVECMLKGYSLRMCAERCGITLRTALAWRHKILNALDEQALPEHYLNATKKAKSAIAAELLIAQISKP